ncbi:tripartite ATP-independent periplasmic transporter DctQ component [Oleidesulfovibrio alaskensis G20]|jgi:TRAP-type C4-dicarboxylate transport system permease small subunit|uniref:Tripartite ATP-independent periplasmic transporter DctQ component n=1 Tax=Oleidesulfovibrio alaskensis (strain ATCC BAA-1058 / DSM 17464 / G20) TaxID=207559 RepID=Q315G0_OLEA2|nr:TRAP transporter small permease subunit [Oleidesulfovibrio alaskensis]ABB37436.1 tripartite ATP-independent periplasmic transporter DctQ component [Oleidesulfovibrio alaskensis G20]MBG0774472.1 TRAP transporter small permease subunit [Oleidesulfovibrio alaskensis]MBL3580819.1 TRAP transporter small permease subunit [Oleidesulfovibrio alaskensis]
MEKILTAMERLGELLAKVMAAAAGCTLVLMVMLACGNIAGRALGMPVKGTFELLGFMGALVAGLSLAFAQRHKAHIFVAFFVARFTRPVRLVLDAAVYFCSALFFAAASRELIGLGAFITDFGELSETLHLAYAPFVYVVSAGCGVMAYILSVSFLKTVLLGREV